MATLKDIIYYIIKTYPIKDHLSNARITKMIYLADWYSANVFHHQITDIKWYFNNYGPFVNDILETATQNNNLFSVNTVNNFYGAPKRIIGIKKDYTPTLADQDIQAIQRVIEVTKGKTWEQFITFVYSTYPIVSSERYTELDLLKLAEDYKKTQKEDQ